jgi:NTP pyrophosphatase (non-canonical NTP hydrolase)
MTDSKTTIDQIKKEIEQFITDRDWGQFHNPKNLASNLMVEAAELLEAFVWDKSQDNKSVLLKKKEAIEHEAADVLFSLVAFCHKADIDLAAAFEKKLKLTAEKYPVEKVKGKNLKYNEY